MTTKATREDEVHELLRSAKVRYACRVRDDHGTLTNDRAEKYLFFSDEYEPPSFLVPSRVMVINVFYDNQGIVTRADGIESVEDVFMKDCTRQQ